MDWAVFAAFFPTLVFLEVLLSFDNAAVIAVVARGVSPADRRAVLVAGLAGGYAFRAIALVLAGFVAANPWARMAGGAYLAWVACLHFLSVPMARPRSDAQPQPRSFWGTVLAVELADAAFALDQVVVAVAITREWMVLLAAAAVGMLALRFGAMAVGRLLDAEPRVETAAYCVVAFAAAKILAEAVGFTVPLWVEASIPPAIFFAVPAWRAGEYVAACWRTFNGRSRMP